MLQLTYISTVTPGTPPDVLESILLTSRRRNAAAGVTGLLVFDGRRFLQALEGEESAVRTAYDRIQRDPRHRAVVLLSSREITARDFGEWAMASRLARAPVDGQTIADAVDALTECVTDPNARALFRSFARLERRAA